MKLKELIDSTNWYSVELTLLETYPDTKDIIERYKDVYEKIKLIEPEPYEMKITLTICKENNDNQIMSYVHVCGKELSETKSQSYTLEFTEWKKWLGMELAKETINNFSESEIVAHCLYEMTFVAFEESEIQEEFNSIKNIIKEYENLTDENKKDKFISLDELMKQLKEKSYN